MALVPLPSWVTVPALLALGAWAAWRLPRRATGDAALGRLVVWSFAARAALALALFAASWWGWPVLRSLQAHGFWSFGIDARVYHLLGEKIAEAWRQGVELPFVDLGIEYFLVVAAWYFVFGPTPLHPILFNCWLGAINGLLAYLIARQLGDSRRTARLAALLVAWWPSSLIWSAQMLKDVGSWSVMLTVLWLTLRLLSDLERRAAGRGGGASRAAAWVVLAGLSILMTRLRFYLGAVLRLVLLAIVLSEALWAALRRRWMLAMGRLGLVVLLVGATVAARTINLVALVSPPHPDGGHFRLAIRELQEGDLIGAGSQFREVIRLNPNFKEAYLGLAAVEVQQQQFNQAAAVYEAYLGHDNPDNHPTIKRVIAEVRLKQGDTYLSDEPVAAWTVYQMGLAYDRSIVDLYLQSSLALSLQLQFEWALAMADRASELATTPEEQARASSVRDVVRRRQAFTATYPVAETSERKMVEILNTIDASSATPAASTLPAASAFGSANNAEELSLSVFLMQPVVKKISFTGQRLAPQRTAYGAIPEKPASLSKILKEFHPETVAGARHDVVMIGGHSTMDPSASISTPGAMLRYLPRALLIGFLAPFPWQWLDAYGSTGMMKTVAGAEALLIYVLLPALLLGLWRLLKRRRLSGYVLLGFCFALASAMSLVVANLGTLFRLRLLFWLPLLVVVAIGRPLALYRRIGRRIRERGTMIREPGTVSRDPAMTGSPLADHGSLAPDDVRDCRGSPV